MNITAWRAACRCRDLDPGAKHALQTICGHLARPPAAAVELPIGQLAVDMGKHYDTARRAVVRLVEAGYLSVENRIGRPAYLVLNLERLGVNLADSAEGDLADSARTPRGIRPNTSSKIRDPKKDLMDTYGSGETRSTSKRRRPAAERNGAAPRHPPDCPHCDGTGWTDNTDGTVTRCPGAPVTR